MAEASFELRSSCHQVQTFSSTSATKIIIKILIFINISLIDQLPRNIMTGNVSTVGHALLTFFYHDLKAGELLLRNASQLYSSVTFD